MGAFNVVVTEMTCPVCKIVGVFEVQYKYGNTWQFRYAMGEAIAWGGNDIGEPGKGCVLVEGWGGPCSNCHEEYIAVDVVIEHDQLTGVHPIGRERDEDYPDGFRVVLE